MKTYH